MKSDSQIKNLIQKHNAIKTFLKSYYQLQKSQYGKN